MRVIAGTCRGRPLRAPAGAATRPTADRVREAIFDVLGSIVGPDGLAGATVWDLFAGSGALGIEALSREAARAVFVDRDRRAVATVRRNLVDLGLGDRGVVVQADVATWLQDRAPGGSAGGEPVARGPDLVLCDPPYAFGDWPALLCELRAPILVAESDRPLEVPAPWIALKRKRYGGTLVTVVGCPSATAEEVSAAGPGPRPPTS